MQLILLILCMATTIAGVLGMIKAGDNHAARRLVAALAAALLIFHGQVAVLLYPLVCGVVGVIFAGVLLVAICQWLLC